MELIQGTTELLALDWNLLMTFPLFFAESM